MSVYTRRGDKGQTGLYDPKGSQDIRIEKDSLVVEVLGLIDELNSYIGLAVSKISDKKIHNELVVVQDCLLTIGSIFAGSKLNFSKSKTSHMEKMIDYYEGILPSLSNFIIPGGSLESSILHICRSMTRRVERRVVALSKVKPINPYILSYFNRLSDYFFILARAQNKSLGIDEKIWKKFK